MFFLISNTDAVKRKKPKRVHVLDKTWKGPSESGYWTRDRDGKRKECSTEEKDKKKRRLLEEE